MRMRRWIGRGAVVAVAGATLVGPVRAQEPVTVSDPAVGPLIAGRSSYVAGTFAWTDYAYDDRGPDTDARPGGDARYPATMDPNNVADLIQLQVRPAGDSAVELTAVLETLTPATNPVLGVAFDSDGDASTGAAALPGSWTPSAPLGVDRLFVLTPGGGSSHTAADGTWAPDGSFAVTVDPEANTLAATVPFPLPAGGPLRAVAALGYGDTGGSWLTGASPVHDLAFVPGEPPVTPYLQSVTDAIANFASGGDTMWQDFLQSAILGGRAAPDAAVASIDVTAMRAGATALARPDAKGFHTFLYRSQLRLGEGVRGIGNTALYAGPYQPYLVWVPATLRPGLPLVMYLHGASQTHLSGVNTAHYAPETRDPVLGLPETFFDFDAVVAWPFGRGPLQSYTGASEQDVLDVTDDVLARLALDPERVMLAGLSMGGYGTFRLAQLYPDRWSVAYADVGADRTGLVENLTALPVRFQNGAADYLVHVNQALETRVRLDAAGTVDYRSWLLHKGHHQPAVRLAECVYRESFTRPRVTNPARVRYTVDPAMFVDDPATGLRLVYGGAYWVSGMEPAGSARGSVDLTSLAFGAVPAPGATTSTTRENFTAGRDFCGPNPDANTGESWDEQARAVPLVAEPAEPVVAGTLAGLRAVTVAADRAGLPAAGPARLELAADRAADLTLTGLAPGTPVANGGDTVHAGPAGTATIPLGAGANHVAVG